ncbi:MAG TPA: amidohydrolase family protein [Solirubrobacteraceae bacterium]|jgi:predicted TIM-barrel fold metal-dependent hydrolase|nr:amidohydrolase family protein [Solirubrobacteraceae bacterium]
MRIDVHQHVWTEPLIEALSRREQLPFVRRSGGLTLLHSAGEQPYLIDLAAEAPARRAALVRADGLDLALVAISSPIGIEALPREQALELIDAHLAGVQALGPEFAAWGPLPLDRPAPDDVDRLLAQGCIGVSLPAQALAGYDALDAAGPVLERVAQNGATLMIHPGRPAAHSCGVSLNEPLWWSALTDYVAQMQAAWLTFAARGRREHPSLAVLWTMLAGEAPLHTERLAARGGPPIDLRDPLSFYETSSYGPVAIEVLARRVGAEQLVYGSDRPVIEPVSTGRDVLLQEQGAAVLAGVTAL